MQTKSNIKRNFKHGAASLWWGVGVVSLCLGRKKKPGDEISKNHNKYEE